MSQYISGYILDTSGYVYLGLFITTEFHDTSGYTEIQVHDTCVLEGYVCGIQISEMHTSNEYPERYVSEIQAWIQDTFGIHVSAEVIKILIKIHTGYI